MKFGYEDLDVWKKAMEFASRVIKISELSPISGRHIRLFGQLEAAAVSIPMNLAEGKGRFSKKEFIQYCYISRGSLYECMTLLELFKKNLWIDPITFESLKSEGLEIAAMIKGLINSLKRNI
jgi:four helix bundle protein